MRRGKITNLTLQLSVVQAKCQTSKGNSSFTFVFGVQMENELFIEVYLKRCMKVFFCHVYWLQELLIDSKYCFYYPSVVCISVWGNTGLNDIKTSEEEENCVRVKSE